MTALEVLSELNRVGAELKIIGDQVRCRAPEGALTDELRAAVKARKWELIRLLANSVFAPGASPWPLVSPAAHLYPALHRGVRTPLGTGRLCQVFSNRVAVVLDGGARRVCFFEPDEVRPLAGMNFNWLGHNMEAPSSQSSITTGQHEEKNPHSELIR